MYIVGMSLHKIGDRKTYRSEYGWSPLMSKKIRGRSVKGLFKTLTFIHCVLPPEAIEVKVYKNKKWQHDLTATQRAYKKCRYFK